VAVAILLIVVLSASLWLGLFRLFALFF